jgi:O-antigen/teichoic acid export membrane protein
VVDNTKKDNYSELIKHDLKLSVITGPITFVIPLISYFFLYPIILSRSNLEVLGIWSLYVTTATFFTVADLGFSQHFIREAGKDRDATTLSILKLETVTASRFYLLLGLAGIIIVSIFRDVLFESVSDIYSAGGLFISAIILIISTTVQLISSIDAAVLSARADNYYVKIIKSFSPIFTYSIAIIGALFQMPIEGFAAGALISNLFLVFTYRKRIKRNHHNWQMLKNTLPTQMMFESFKELLKKGWKLYIVSIGMIIRQPVFRYVIALSLGLPAAGIFDIAMRLTSASRDIISSGFGSLFPSLSYFYRINDNHRILEIIRKSLIILLPVGIIAASILIYSADVIYKLWLPVLPSGIVTATAILAIWQLMTILNVPFWFLLQAAHQEKIAAVAIWAHTVLIILLIPLKIYITGLSLNTLLIYWTVTAIFTQLQIYFYVEKRLSMFWDVFKDFMLNKIIILSLIYFIIQIVTQTVIQDSTVNLNLLNLGLAIIFLLVLMPLYLQIIRQHILSKKTLL